jgi:hypothetical protein
METLHIVTLVISVIAVGSLIGTLLASIVHFFQMKRS